MVRAMCGPMYMYTNLWSPWCHILRISSQTYQSSWESDVRKLPSKKQTLEDGIHLYFGSIAILSCICKTLVVTKPLQLLIFQQAATPLDATTN